MLVTLKLANTYKIGNHNKDSDTTYISSLEIKSMSLKSGLADDTISVTIPKIALDSIDALIYLTNNYSIEVYLYIDEVLNLVLDGIVNRVVHDTSKNITLSVGSKAAYYNSQMFFPKIQNVCQLQIYSEICKVQEDDFKLSFTNVHIDTLTGRVPFILTTTSITLGDTTIDITGKQWFIDRANYNEAFIRLNGLFRSKILRVGETSLSIDLNYIDDELITSFDIILSCDKSYGTCYKKFSNTQNYFGFTNVGKSVKNYNIFTSEALVYCGESPEIENNCALENNNIFGVIL